MDDQTCQAAFASDANNAPAYQPVYFAGNNYIQGGQLDAGGNRVTSVGDPCQADDAVNLQSMQDAICGPTAQITVTLTGTTPVALRVVAAGAFIVMVSPLYFSGLTATFSVAKASFDNSGHVVNLAQSRLTATPAQLVLTWASDGVFRLSKTTNDADGQYKISFCGSAPGKMPPPPMSISLGICLQGTNQKIAATITFGSFYVTIVPLTAGYPCCSMTAAKAGSQGDGHVVRLAQGNANTPCQLLLSWQANGAMVVSKSTNNFDGCYKIILTGFGC